MRTNKDRTCICCGDTIPAGSSRMIPRHAKANHGLCFPCFRKWRDTGGDLKLMNNPGDAKKEYVIHMSNILKGNCDIIKGRKLYVAFKKAINGGKKIVIKFDTDQQLENTLRAWRRITESTNLYCKKDWRNFPTQPPVRGRDDGLPFDVDYLTIPYKKWRKESIKAYGNAIIPKIAYKFFKIINDIENGMI